jgi:hypothetical protein
MENNFHFGWCPFCNQGWVNAIKDSGSSKILLLCYECDTTWNTPSDISLDTPMNYDLMGQLEIPSLKEIQELGWDKFLK